MSRYFTKPVTFDEEEILKTIRQKSYKIKNPDDLNPLMQRIDNARVVMLG